MGRASLLPVPESVLWAIRRDKESREQTPPPTREGLPEEEEEKIIELKAM